MFSLESPQRGDSNEYTQYIPFLNIKKKVTVNYPKSANMGFVPMDQRTSLKQLW